MKNNPVICHWGGKKNPMKYCHYSFLVEKKQKQKRYIKNNWLIHIVQMSTGKISLLKTQNDNDYNYLRNMIYKV